MSKRDQVSQKLSEKQVYPDQLTLRSGIFTARWGYFYRHGRSASRYEDQIREVFPSAEIIDSGDHWAPFKGGASIHNSSHFYVKFKLD